MDAAVLNEWRRTIKRILAELAAIPFPDVVPMTAKAVFDESSDNYLVMVEGWQGVRRPHGCMVHVEIKDGKVWIHLDGTEHGIANDLLTAGLHKDQIVLAFKSPQSRQYTDFAVA